HPPRARQPLDDGLVELAPMTRDQRGQKLLLDPPEARQFRVREQITAVLMVFRMRDVEADLVQARGPLEQLTAARIVEPPSRLDLIEQRLDGSLDPGPLLLVDVVAMLHAAHRPLARVLVAEATQHVVEQPLAKRAFARIEVLEPEPR